MRETLSRVDRETLTEALGHSHPSPQASKAAVNAFNALRRHRDPATVLDRPQYRPALPLLAAAVADECLDACIEKLGDHADDPTRAQLDEALEEIGGEFPVPVVAVMLASVADSGMNASDLCFEILTTDERFGLADAAGEGDAEAVGAESSEGRAGDSHETCGSGEAVDDAAETARDSAEDGAAVQRREERRVRRRREAEARAKRADAARRSAEQMRRARRRRPESPRPTAATDDATAGSRTPAPRLRRRAALSPLQEQEFDRDDPWSGAVVFAWIPFTPEDPADRRPEDGSELEGKSRPCVVVAGSSTHLLVRPGYSQGGMKSRGWKAVELRGWRRAGFDQPTWIDIEMVRIPRDPELSTIGWVSADDWNALW